MIPLVVALQVLAFTDATEKAGVAFRHETGAEGEKHMIETMGAGVVFFDYDGDSDPDLLFVNGAGESAVTLLRNDGRGGFTDVTGGSGLEHSGYGMGATAADYDNDGDPDLYVTHYGPNVLFRNQGDGTFEDVSARAGVADERWGASATWTDLDADGFVDLYVTNYVDWSLQNNPNCSQTRDGETIRAYCLPDAFRGVPDELYRSSGDGRFEAVGTRAGIALRTGKGLGVLSLDYDDDGLTDLYVANDTVPNFLFRNLGALTFEEVGLLVGASYDADGNALAGMGVTHADYDRDGDLDVFVTNFEGETNTLYRYDDDGFFTDASQAAGIGRPSLDRLGFGTAFADLDNDGDADLVVANGHVLDNADVLHGGEVAQPNQVFVNDGGTFSASTLPGIRVSRGLALADVDGDFDLDIAVSNSGDEGRLLLNETGGRGAVRIVLVGRVSNRDGIGVVLDTPSGRIETTAASSYLSQSERVVHVSAPVDEVSVRWPSGRKETRGPFQAGQRVVWVEPRN